MHQFFFCIILSCLSRHILYVCSFFKLEIPLPDNVILVKYSTAIQPGEAILLGLELDSSWGEYEQSWFGRLNFRSRLSMVYLEWALLEDQELHYKWLGILENENVQHLSKINLNRTDVPPYRTNNNLLCCHDLN